MLRREYFGYVRRTSAEITMGDRKLIGVLKNNSLTL